MSLPNPYEKLPAKYKQKTDNPNFDKHGINLHFRMVVSAPSGSGKTSFVYNLLHIMDNTFDRIMVITCNKNEPLYEHLEEKSKGRIVITEGLSTIPDMDEFKKDQQYLIVFDDLVNKKDQSKIINYFIRCRKKNCSAIYITQSWFDTPTIIRKNINYAVFLKGGGVREMKTILRDFSMDDINVLKNMTEYATKDKFQVLMVHKEEQDNTKKFRKGFLECLNPADFASPK
jgi:GTPase SAR1 family protein